MSVYYTGRGDDGISRVGLKKIAKTDLAMSALGDLDELNSLLGVIKNLTSPPRKRPMPLSALSLVRRGGKKRDVNLFSGGEVSVVIQQIQENLFIIQARVASGMFGKLYKPPKFSKEKVAELENTIARFEKKLKPVKKFVVPGANEESAWLDYARAVSRRAERSVLQFSKKEKVSPEIIAYLNRLSSLLFVLARVSAKKRKEQSPKY